MRRGAQKTAYALGVFSIGLGLAELMAPRAVARAVGLRGRENLVRLYGLREIATGIGLLTGRASAPWMWGRVAGDVLDLATLAQGRKPAAYAAMAAVGGVAVADVATAAALERPAPPRARQYDYSDRSGFPRPVEEMRGKAAQKPLS